MSKGNDDIWKRNNIIYTPQRGGSQEKTVFSTDIKTAWGNSYQHFLKSNADLH